ncbi:hypothetical protein MTQ04_10225 [Micrococcus sp. XM4230A]|uniref:hypothetical protein n=1 Tax=unclassified Micrococcus TaxID=2620948 RepID=UPI0019D170C8|nr:MULTISPECIES: hypothetical protein [unclassified Micrococcus]MCK1800901.1 hypothetical protein [Micrococcus sp. XM4230B]MCK1812320.1 hypothetical protein [Micrococcus sp. XM4230A]
MEYLVPVLAVVVIGALAFTAARWMSAGRARQAADQRTLSGRGLDIGPERARLAAGLLDEDAHRRVYGHIAQSRVMEAVRDYRAHTGRGLKDAVMDVQSLAVHPQVYSEPAQEPDATSAGAAGPVSAGHEEPHRDDAAPAETPGPERPGQDSSGQREPDAQTPDRETSDAVAEDDARQDTDHASAAPRPTATPADELTTLTVPAEWTAAPAEEEFPFEVEVMRGTESVRLSSQDLPPWLRDQLSAMVRDGNLESAAVQLSSHSELSVPEAYELLRRMRERRGEG